MTKLPHESWQVQPVQDKAHYKVAAFCANPMCRRPADHAHHIWRRSFLNGDYAWVRTPGGAIVGNLCGLCWQCHQRITENLDAISWDGEMFHYVSSESRNNGPDMRLHPHPPIEGKDMQTTIDGREVPHNDVMNELHKPYGETCDMCHGTGRRKTKKKNDLPPGEKRPRVNWSVSVPKDERENGAAVLDEMMEGCREMFDRADEKSWRYFTLVQALYFCLQHSHLFQEEAA